MRMPAQPRLGAFCIHLSTRRTFVYYRFRPVYSRTKRKKNTPVYYFGIIRYSCFEYFFHICFRIEARTASPDIVC